MGKDFKIVKYFLVLSLVLFVLNFLSVFTPEIGFDALWYHLTLPKLWLLNHQYYFPGGLLYYSVMPRLTEWIFTPLIYFFGTTGPKFLQLLSGLGVCWLTYKIARAQNLGRNLSVLAGCLFYLSFLVSWQSSSAYIDLFRSFLELSALYFFLNNNKFLGAILLGLSLGTKWLSLFSVVIYGLVFGLNTIPFSLIIALPWFITSFFFTGNPVFPLFSNILQNGFQPLSGAVYNLFTAPIRFTIPFDDFISPVAGILFSLAGISFVFASPGQRKIISIGLFGALSTLILDPPSARFFLPYYPIVIISAFILVQKLQIDLQKTILCLFLFSSVVVVALRIIAFKKNIPYLLGRQSTNQYLTSLSSRLPDTFIDSDGFIKNNLENQKIIIDKLHNLYYFPYPFDHTSWEPDMRGYNYLVTINQDPKEINGALIHTNSVGIQVFKLSQ